MDPCAVNMSVSALACAIAKDKTASEIAALGAFFNQLGDSLTTIIAFRELNEDCGGSNK